MLRRLAIAAVVLAGCAGELPPVAELPRAEVRVAGRLLETAVADTPASRARGLRGQELGQLDGLLFRFDLPAAAGFTMAGVDRPLDVVLIELYGRELVVADRLTMEPCAGQLAACPVYGAGQLIVAAIEAPAGELAFIRQGDPIHLTP